MLKQQVYIFLTALMFYTRIPCPIKLPYSADYLNKASRYFPAIGYMVAGISWGVFACGIALFNMHIAVALSLLVGVLVTGGFHEDGLADSADGFGGGWNKQDILTIMKDSRTGAYGVIAVVLLFLIKFLALVNILALIHTKHPQYFWLLSAFVFCIYHALARLTAINLVFISKYSREDATSKVKPIAKTHGKTEIVGAYIFGLLPVVFLIGVSPNTTFHSVIFPNIFICLLPLIVLVVYTKIYFEKWIDGYTGDCLGAVEQIAECVILLSLGVLWKFM